MTDLDVILVMLPIVFIGLAAVRSLPIDKAPSSRLVLFALGASLLNLARGILVGAPWLSLFFFVLSTVSAVWAYRKAVQTEILFEGIQRRRLERELDES